MPISESLLTIMNEYERLRNTARNDPQANDRLVRILQAAERDVKDVIGTVEHIEVKIPFGTPKYPCQAWIAVIDTSVVLQ